MEKINNLFGKYEQAVEREEELAKKRSGPRNARDEFLEYFFKRLSPSWKGKAPFTMRLLAIKISHLKSLSDLAYLKSICEDGERRGKAFSYVFWGSLKPRPDDKYEGRT